MTLRLCALALLAGMLGLCACQQWRLPSSEQVEEVFAPEKPTAMLDSPQPKGIAAFNTSKTEDWHALCNQCHKGPSYSSHTILNWGHLAQCLDNSSCVGCHGEQLHRMDVRGNKQVCFDCHLKKRLPVDCANCHIKGWKEQHSPHGAEFFAGHGASALADKQACLKCHGSENWCTACHGLPMPHDADMPQKHPGMVQGKPERCANCHGAKPCESCHTARGIVLR